jgi:hypothetical protein
MGGRNRQEHEEVSDRRGEAGRQNSVCRAERSSTRRNAEFLPLPRFCWVLKECHRTAPRRIDFIHNTLGAEMVHAGHVTSSRPLSLSRTCSPRIGSMKKFPHTNASVNRPDVLAFQ